MQYAKSSSLFLWLALVFCFLYSVSILGMLYTIFHRTYVESLFFGKNCSQQMVGCSCASSGFQAPEVSSQNADI